MNRSQFAIGSRKHRNPRFPPWAFTEHGALAAAFVLNSSLAVEMSVQVVRAFVRLRELLRTNEDLARRMTTLERRATVTERDVRRLASAFEQSLATPPKISRRRMGFTPATEEPESETKGRGRGTRGSARKARV